MNRKGILLSAIATILLLAAAWTAAQEEQEELRLDYLVRNAYNANGDSTLLDAPYAVQVSPDGDLYIADTANNRLVKFVKGDFAHAVFYPNAAANISSPEVEVVSGVTGGVDPKILSYSRVDTDKKLLKPIGIAMDEYYVYVADTGNGRVIALKEEEGLEELKFSHALGFFKDVGLIKDIATDGAGNVYLLDSRNGRVLKYLWYGKKVSFSTEVEEITGLLNPQGLTIDITNDENHGYIYVTDTTRHEVIKYTLAGVEVRKFGGKGKAEGSLLYPNDVAVDDDGNLYVADTENYRIEKFSKDGDYLGFFGDWGWGKGQFLHNRKISLGKKDGKVYLFAVDSTKMDVQIIDMSPTFVISHEPFKFISRNPEVWKATVESYIPGAVRVDLMFQILGQPDHIMQIPETGDKQYEKNYTMLGLQTGDTLLYRFKGTMIDSGVINYSDYVQIPVDLTPPQLVTPEEESFSPAEGTMFGNNATIEIKALYYDLGLGMDVDRIVLLFGGKVIAPDKVTDREITAKVLTATQPQGEREIELRLYDKAGHETIAKRKVLIDKEAPTVSAIQMTPIDFPLAGVKKDSSSRFITTKRMRTTAQIKDFSLDEFRIDLFVSAEAGWTTIYGPQKLTGGIYDVSYIFASQNYVDGYLQMKIVATDKAGNKTERLAYIANDNTKPKGAIIEPYFGQVLNPDVHVVGGKLLVKAKMTDKFLQSYSVKAGPYGQSGQCAYGHDVAPQTLMDETFGTLTQVADLQKETMWEIPQVSDGNTYIYTVSIKMSDAYQDIVLCQSFNIGVAGIVITPLPENDMVNNNIKYDLSDSGHVTVDIYRAKQYSPITSFEYLDDTTVATKIRTIISGVDQPRGVNEVPWDGLDNSKNKMTESNGTTIIYYYKITAENDAYEKSYAFGKINLVSMPTIRTITIDPTTYQICYQTSKNNLVERNVYVNNSKGMEVISFNKTQAAAAGTINGFYNYCINWNGKNRYGQLLESGDYALTLKIEDTYENKAEWTVNKTFGETIPAVAQSEPTKRRTDYIMMTPTEAKWPKDSQIIISQTLSPNIIEINTIKADAETFDNQTINVLSVRRNLEIMKNTDGQNYMQWDGRSYFGSLKTDYPAGNYIFSSYNSSWGLLGTEERSLLNDPSAPNITIEDKSTSTDLKFKVSVPENELIKSWLITIYDGDNNLIGRDDGRDRNDAWDKDGGIGRRKTITKYVSIQTGLFSKNQLKTNLVRVKAEIENVSGHVSRLEKEFTIFVPFTADTGAVVISEDKNAMLRIPPKSVKTGGVSYSSFNVIEHDNPAADPSYPALSSGVNFLGKVYEFNPSNVEFDTDNPPILTLYYQFDKNTGKVVMNGVAIGAPEDVLAFYYFNEARNEYERIGGAYGIENYGKTNERRYIWAPMYHLSEYFLAAKVDVTDPVAKIIKPATTEKTGKKFDLYIDAYDYQLINIPNRPGFYAPIKKNIKKYTIDYGKGTSPDLWIRMSEGFGGYNVNLKAGEWDATGFIGSYTLRLIVEDQAGNKTVVTSAYNFAGTGPSVDEYETVPPKIAPISLSSAMFANKSSFSVKNRLFMYLTVNEPTTIVIDVYQDTGRISHNFVSGYQPTPNKEEKFTYLGTAPTGWQIADGRYRFKITATDLAGNESIAYSQYFINDNKGPDFSDMIPEKNSLSTTARPNISVKIDDDGAGTDKNYFSILYNTKPVSNGYSYNTTTKILTFKAPTDVIQGKNTVSITARDLLLNTTTYEWNFFGDNTAPSIRVPVETNDPFSSTESPSVKDKWYLNVAVTDYYPFMWTLEILDGTNVLKSYSGEKTYTGVEPYYIDEDWDGLYLTKDFMNDPLIDVVDDGTYSYRITATDYSSNTSVRTGTVEIDNTEPIVGGYSNQTIILSPGTTWGYNDSYSASFTVNEQNPDKRTMRIKDIYGQEIYSVTYDGYGSGGIDATISWNGRNKDDNAPVEDGYYSVTWVYYDKAGNYTIVSDGVVVDTTPPETTDNIHEITYRTNPVFELKSKDMISGVKEIAYCLYRPGIDAACAPDIVYDEEVGISVSIDGGWRIRYKATDYGMNVEVVKTSVKFTVDTTPPSPPVLKTADIQNWQSVVYSNVASPWISGEAEPGTTVKLYLSGGPDILIGTVKTGDSGQFVTKINYQLSNGECQIYATAEHDSSSVSSKSMFKTYVMNNSAPVVFDTAPGSHIWFNTDVSFDITMMPSIAGVKSIVYCIYLSSSDICDPHGAEAIRVYGQYSTTVTISGDGKWYIRYVAEDLAGNSSAVKTTASFIDSEQPVGTASHYISGTSSAPVLNITLKGLDDNSGIEQIGYCFYTEDSQSCELSTDGTIIMGGSSTSLHISQEGVWNVKYYFVDYAGNASSEYTYSVNFDKTPPQQLSWEPANGGLLDFDNPAIAVTLDEPGVCSWYYRNVTVPYLNSCDAIDKYHVNCALLNPPEGNVLLSITCTDGNGNSDTNDTDADLTYLYTRLSKLFIDGKPFPEIVEKNQEPVFNYTVINHLNEEIENVSIQGRILDVNGKLVSVFDSALYGLIPEKIFVKTNIFSPVLSEPGTHDVELLLSYPLMEVPVVLDFGTIQVIECE